MTANEIAAKVQRLTPASQSVHRLITLLGRPAINNDEIVRVLKYDSAITARLLRACNSSFYGFDEPVASVEQAVLTLGHREILHMVFSIAYKGALAAPLPAYAAQANELWRHSLATALNCELLALMGPPQEVESSIAFTAGLLHDIGKLALNEVLPNESQTAIRHLVKGNGRSCAEAEREVIGTDHAEVGAALLSMWKLPPEIVEAVANHHNPVLNPRPQLSAIVHTADCLSHLTGSTAGWDSFAGRVADGVTDALEFTRAKMERLIVVSRSSLAQAELSENL